MKCDELENKDYNNGMTAYELMEENGLVNTAKTVKDAIAELKAENERLKKQSSCTFSDDCLRVRQLKRKIADNSEKILELQKSLDVALSEVYTLLDKIESLKASHYTEMVDAGMRERRLRRAFYKACANWAIWRACVLEYFCIKINAKKWERMHYKCLAKAEEFK